MVSVERSIEYVNLEPERTSDPVVLPPDDWPRRGNVEFRNFYLRYTPTSQWALDNINLYIEDGLKVI